MKICYLTFNFPRDYALAAALHAKLHEHSPAEFIWCIESKHAGVPVPECVQLLVRDFNRGGSLKHTEALHAMARIYAELAEKYDCIVKLDADTALFRPLYFTDYIAAGGDLSYIPHEGKRGTGNGCCYALSARAAKSFVEINPAEFDARAHSVGGREDMFFTGAAAAVPGHYVAMIPRNRISWCGSIIQPECAIAAHLGYLDYADACERMNELDGGVGSFKPFMFDDYARQVADYCRENGIEIKPQTIRYGLDGIRRDEMPAQTFKGTKIS